MSLSAVNVLQEIQPFKKSYKSLSVLSNLAKFSTMKKNSFAVFTLLIESALVSDAKTLKLYRYNPFICVCA